MENVCFKKVRFCSGFYTYATYKNRLVVLFTTPTDLGLYFIANFDSIKNNRISQPQLIIADDFDFLNSNQRLNYGYNLYNCWHKILFKGLDFFTNSYWNYDKKIKSLNTKNPINKITDLLYSLVNKDNHTNKQRFYLKSIVKKFICYDITFDEFVCNIYKTYNLDYKEVIKVIAKV